MFSAPKYVPVIVDGNNHRKILLDSSVTKEQANALLDSTGVDAELTDHEVLLSYDNFSYDEILRKLLPQDIIVPTSFETIGHIAHLNLDKSQEPFKEVIGQVIIEKNPKIRTVVNKTNVIDTTFRTFAMECIAGDNNMNTEVNESKCRFRFDYSQVYWNSRLQLEHERIVEKFTSKDIVCDMFAGVGPFALPAAKNKRCVVHANDLNPKSYEYLVKNAKLNKVERLVKAYNMDGRDFVRSLVSASPLVPFTQVIMNLPASAETFLDVFRDYPVDRPAPKIHCYVFAVQKDETDVKLEAVKLVEHYLQKRLEKYEAHDVRDVAPKKHMICVSFDLPVQGSIQASSSSDNNNNNNNINNNNDSNNSNSNNNNVTTEVSPSIATGKRKNMEEDNKDHEETKEEKEDKLSTSSKKTKTQ